MRRRRRSVDRLLQELVGKYSLHMDVVRKCMSKWEGRENAAHR